MDRNGFWVLVLLLVLLVEPLREGFWGLLLNADALSLLAVLFIVWYLTGSR